MALPLPLNEFIRPLFQQIYDASPPILTSLVDQSNQIIAWGWSTTIDLTSSFMSDSHYFRICVLPTGISLALFWMLNIPLLFFNFYPNLNPIESWKIQKGRYETLDRVAWMVVVVVVNQTVAMAISMSQQNYQGLLDLNYQSGMADIPTLGDLLWQVTACCYLYDAIFFACHCLMHTKWLYHNIHKVHHKVKHSKITIGISSAYFHPADYVFSAIAVVLPPLLVSNHVLTSCLWMTVFMFETTNAHCGYEIPFAPSAKDHDFHHSHSFYSSKEYRFVTMGAFALVWDRLFGTKQPVDDWWAKNPNGITKRMKAPVEKDQKKD
ncbi:hypothetical protein TrLO_g6480 [Triparma laevis f. longispina]|uniref:Fatty acid hydroxylase domain-containing protein n=1 Tax=Triparma laevis f. longispina TaxID=1714387 RepID=A0A9W7CNZ6_9STRA|nr:hypothetical protein TrLO_g6480 [Triparma laevis f. longispina]